MQTTKSQFYVFTVSCSRGPKYLRLFSKSQHIGTTRAKYVMGPQFVSNEIVLSFPVCDRYSFGIGIGRYIGIGIVIGIGRYRFLYR